MEKEFKLDEKIIEVYGEKDEDKYKCEVKDIKEFIKRVRQECEELQESIRKMKPCFNWKFLVKGEGLDKLAGDKLI